MRAFASMIILSVASLTFSQDRLSLVIPTGHTRPVQEFAFSSDSIWLASVDFEPEIILWDLDARKQLLQLRGHSENITQLEFFEGRLFSSGNDGRVIEWDLKKAIPGTVFSHKDPVINFHILQDKLITLTGQGVLYLWQRGVGTVTDSLKVSENKLTTISPTTNNDIYLIGDEKGNIYEADIAKVEVIKSAKVSESEINATVFYGNKLYLGNAKGELIVVDEVLKPKKAQQVMDYRIYDMEIDSLNNSLYISGRDESQHIKMLDLISLIPDESTVFPYLNNPLGISSIDLTKNGLLYATPAGFIVEFDLNKKETFFYRGEASPVNSIMISEGELYLANSDFPVKKIDLKGIRTIKSISASGEGIKTLSLDPLGRTLVTLSEKNELIISDPAIDRIISSQEINSRYSSTPVVLDPSGTFIVRKNHPDYLTLYHRKKASSDKLNVDGFRFKFSRDGRFLFVLNPSGIEALEVPKFKNLFTIKGDSYQDFDVSFDKIVAIKKDKKSVDLFSLEGDKLHTHTFDSVRIERVIIHPDGKTAYTYQTSLDPENRSRDFSISVLDIEKGKRIGELNGHSGFIRAVDFYNDGEFIFTASADGKVNIYKYGKAGGPAGSIISLGPRDMVVVTPNGLYDATPEAMKSLHYAKGGDILSLNQFKQSFFEPNLLPRILGIIDDPLPEKNISDVKLHPEVNIKHPNLNDGKLGISLEDMGGGIGKVVIIINGKEVARDARTANLSDSGFQEFDYQISNHPYLKNNEINRVTIKAYNADGSLSSQEKNLFVFPSGEQEENDSKKFFAVVVGTSDYEGEQMDLKFAAKDAEDFVGALSVSAANQFGKENTEIILLTTNSEDRNSWPTKENIDSVFTHFSKEAKASDYLLVYLSGHGVNEEDFYYLTPGASNQKVESLKKQHTISSSELTEMIKRVAALQQVLIIDACHSGRFANELMQLSETTTMGADQIKAIERMKDRTGMYVLAGSKADAVSYEAALFEQGLLTYSILFGMKGAALKAGDAIDVIDLFQFVNEKVPELAEEIGGIQKPELRYPNNANSFIIGKMREDDKKNIQIVESKPVFILSNFQEELSIFDPLKFTSQTNQAMRDAATEGGNIIFIDKNSFAGAYSIWGRYQDNDGLISIKVNIVKDQQIVGNFTEEGLNVELLAEKIVSRAIEMIN